MKRYEGRVAGILGTVIVHLIAAIIFMSFKLQSVRREIKEEFTVEFMETDELEEESDKLIELPASSIEKILQGNEEMLNIARNLANRPDVRIDPAEYINKVKEELIESGKLRPDNYIDEQRRIQENDPEEPLSLEGKDRKEEEQPAESQEMAANYQGPTRIYYDLAGRTHIYLPIPIYKCPGSGKIVLSIHVNQKGFVESAQVIDRESTGKDPCLRETAVTSALISRFNPDLDAPKLQTGTLTYHFVAQ
jgi:protein TonB